MKNEECGKILHSFFVINNSNCPYGGNANIENLHTENREVYEKLIAAKDEQIALLKDLLGKK